MPEPSSRVTVQYSLEALQLSGRLVIHVNNGRRATTLIETALEASRSGGGIGRAESKMIQEKSSLKELTKRASLDAESGGGQKFGTKNGDSAVP